VRGIPEDRALSAIKRGMSIGDGERIGDVNYTVIKRQKTTTWIRMSLFEGKKNEIKRIFMQIRHPVRKLRRIGFGPFKLGTLAVGSYRPFTSEEIAKLKSLLKEPAAKSPKANAAGGNKKH